MPACLANAEQHVVGALHHLAVVGGQVRLAFRGVHHVEVDLLEVGRRQLDIGGEARAAQAHQTAFLYCREERRLVGHLGGCHRVRDGLGAVGFDDHRRVGFAGRIEDGLYGLHGARHAAEDVGGQTPRRVPDEAAHVHVVPFLHDGFAQRSDMLLHGQHDFAWDGHVDGFQFRRVLAMGHDGASRASESRQ